MSCISQRISNFTFDSIVRIFQFVWKHSKFSEEKIKNWCIFVKLLLIDEAQKSFTLNIEHRTIHYPLKMTYILLRSSIIHQISILSFSVQCKLMNTEKFHLFWTCDTIRTAAQCVEHSNYYYLKVIQRQIRTVRGAMIEEFCHFLPKKLNFNETLSVNQLMFSSTFRFKHRKVQIWI